jgi:hypothetical protein
MASGSSGSHCLVRLSFRHAQREVFRRENAVRGLPYHLFRREA